MADKFLYGGEVDTGNRLSDPFSGLPVVLLPLSVHKGAVARAADSVFLNGLAQTGLKKAARQGIRFIPYEAGRKKGLLPVVRPDFLAIKQNGRYQQVEQVMAAIADQDFFDSGYGILLHPGLQRLDRPKKLFRKKGDRYGKDNQGENRCASGSYLGRKRVGLFT